MFREAGHVGGLQRWGMDMARFQKERKGREGKERKQKGSRKDLC